MLHRLWSAQASACAFFSELQLAQRYQAAAEAAWQKRRLKSAHSGRGSGRYELRTSTGVDLLGLFAWSFLAATLIPLGSEPALALIVSRREILLVPVVIATVGNYFGACTTWGLAYGVARAMEKKGESRTMQRASEAIRRYGAPALLLSWVPILGDAIVAAAGAARIGFVPFSLWTIPGKAARYAVVAAIAGVVTS